VARGLLRDHPPATGLVATELPILDDQNRGEGASPGTRRSAALAWVVHPEFSACRASKSTLIIVSLHPYGPDSLQQDVERTRSGAASSPFERLGAQSPEQAERLPECLTVLPFQAVHGFRTFSA
jgi:hypothetical protein